MAKIFVANWKSNKTNAEIQAWVSAAKEGLEKSHSEIIICPSFVGLEVFNKELALSSVKLGVQNLSSYKAGAYTGEVNAEMLKGLVTHAIVGHSERKKYFHETEGEILEKVARCLEVGLTPILCVADLGQLHTFLSANSLLKDNASKIIFVYEPPSAISGGGDFHPESAEEVVKVVAEFKNKLGDVRVLYGGSVNHEMLANFLQKEVINGFLIGKASLEPQEFLELVNQAP